MLVGIRATNRWKRFAFQLETSSESLATRRPKNSRAKIRPRIHRERSLWTLRSVSQCFSSVRIGSSSSATHFLPILPGAIRLAAPLDGYFLPFPSVGGVPTWVGEVETLLDSELNMRMRAQSPGALLVVTRGERTFVVTFEHAWQKLEDEWLERDFGRRVALNSIATDGLV